MIYQRFASEGVSVLRQTAQRNAFHLRLRNLKTSAVLSDQDFIHQSIIPTDHFQKSLPHLPIPKLEDTCERYLDAQHPLLSQQEYNDTAAIVKEFKAGVGQELQQRLIAEDKKNKHTSFVNAPWFDMYLKDRRPITLNHNPFMVFTDDERKEYNDQLLRSTNMLMTSLRFMKTFRANLLEPEIFHLNPDKSDNVRFRKRMRMFPKFCSWYGAYLHKAFPLDMVQYSRLFNSTRIPRIGKDELFQDTTATHICVMRNGHYYTVDCFDKDGNIKSGSEVMACLQHVLNDSRPKPSHPVAVLTSQNRDTWATNRDKLLAAGNESQLRAIDSSIMMLDLDDESFRNDQVIPCSRSFLHGDGSNRWFDKAFQLIINQSGTSALHFEHSWGDGVAVLRFMIELHKETTTNPRVSAGTKPAQIDVTDAVKSIDFNLNNDIKHQIEAAQKEFDTKMNSLNLDYLQYQKFGKNDIKKMKVSPDSFMQLAIQMAYHHLSNGGTAATYESSSTAAYKHGRTETVRSCTNETKSACEMFAQRTGTLPSLTDLADAMKKCSDKHNLLTKNAAMGQGFDRHLFAMRYMCQQTGEAMPALFTDPSYAKLNHIILSTSTLTHPCVVIGGFGPVTPDGYGVGYGVKDEGLGGIVTGYNNQNPSTFLDALAKSFDEMHCVLEGKDFRV